MFIQYVVGEALLMGLVSIKEVTHKAVYIKTFL